MQSQRKMLSSGTAASRRSTRVRSAGAGCAVATLISESVDSGAEDDAGIEVGLAAHEPARHVREGTGVDNQPEPFVRRIGNRHEDAVGSCTREDRLDLHQTAEYRHALEPPSCQARVVVDEPDDLLTGCLPQLTEQAAAAASRADDQGPPPAAPARQRRDRANESPLPEAR